MRGKFTTVLIVVALAGIWVPAAYAENPNPGVVPPQDKVYGKTYGEWSVRWWKWLLGIPAAQNPALDETPTGEFAGIDQGGPVWFLAGSLGDDVPARFVTAPAGKELLFPIYNWVWWAPDDLPIAEIVAEHLGFTPEEIADMTDEELIRLIANYAAGEPEMTCTVDGQPLQDLLSYHVDSPAFRIKDTDLLDDVGATISQPNLAVSAGYWIMLKPLPEGEHTIHWTTVATHSIPDFDADFEVTIHLTIVGDDQGEDDDEQ